MMKKSKTFKKIMIIIFLVIVAIYVVSTFISQQKTLNSYKKTQDYYAMQIETQKKQKETLTELKNNINSPEYVEEIAREKLDMYLPNERVYIDVAQ